MCNPSHHHNSSTDTTPLLPLSAASSSSPQHAHHILGLRLWYFFYFAAQFTQLFLPLVLDKVMLLSSSTIGLLMCLRRFTIFLIAPLFAMLCDLTLMHRQLLTLAHFCYYSSTLLLTRVRSLSAITAVIIAREAFIAGCEPAVNTAAFAKLASISKALQRSGDGGRQMDPTSKFGSLRLFGSLGWGITSLVVPLLCERWFGASLMPVLYAQVVLGIPVLLLVGMRLDLSPALFREARGLKPVTTAAADNKDNDNIAVVIDRRATESSGNKSDNADQTHANYSSIPSSTTTTTTNTSTTIIPSNSNTNTNPTTNAAAAATATNTPSPPQPQPQSQPNSNPPLSPPPTTNNNERMAILCVLAAFEQGVILGATQTTLLIYFAAVGVPVSIIGLSVLLGCLSEGAMFFGDSLIRRYYNSDKRFIQIGVIVNALSLLSYISVSHLPHSGWYRSGLVLGTEVIGGASYALFVSSMVQTANRVAPRKWLTGGQGIVTSVLYGVGPAVGALMSGWLYEKFGIGVLYGGMAVWNVVVVGVLETLM